MLKAYLKLLRWPNLLFIGLILFLAKTQLVDTLEDLSGVGSCLSSLHWILLASATILIAGAGNVVNDIFDQDIDKFNKPEERIIGKGISELRAWNFYYAAVSGGLAIGMFLCWQLGNVSQALIFMLAAGGLYFYSYSYKRQFLVGNIVIALLAGLVPILPLYLEMMCEPQLWSQLPWVPVLVTFSIFSFIITFIREVIKDLQDQKGDQLLGCRTSPIVLGVKGAKALVFVLTAGLIFAIAYLQKDWYVAQDFLLFGYFLALIQLPLIVLIAVVLRASKPAQFGTASKLSKLIMLTGVLSMIAFRITLS